MPNALIERSAAFLKNSIFVLLNPISGYRII